MVSDEVKLLLEDSRWPYVSSLPDLGGGIGWLPDPLKLLLWLKLGTKDEDCCEETGHEDKDTGSVKPTFVVASIELERVTYEFLQPKINTLRFSYFFLIFQQHFAYSLTQAWSKVGHFLGGLLQSPVAGHFGMPMFLLINLYVLYFLDMRFIISLAQI